MENWKPKGKKNEPKDRTFYQRFYPYAFRDDEQYRIFKNVVDNYHSYDVFCIVAPVAFGKTGLAKGILNYGNSQGHDGNVMVPDNELVRQGLDEFPDLASLGLKSHYPSEGAFYRAKDQIQEAKQAILNPMTLLSSRLYKHNLIVDEGHKILSILQDMGGIKIWAGTPGYNPGLQDLTQAVLHFADRKDAQSKKVLKEITKRPDHFCLSYEEDLYHGQPRELLRLYQLSPRYNKPVLWPQHKTKKIFLMSATISMKDVEELGLSDRKVLFMEARSGIPSACGPIVLDFQGSMTLSNQPQTLPRVVNRIKEIASENEGRGFVHATYSVAARLRASMDNTDSERFMFHTRLDKGARLREWLPRQGEAVRQDDNRIFVGSGLTQGLDLKYDKARWQVISKCMLASMGDPAVRKKAQQDPAWYAWNTIREILQAAGRVVRAPDDYGVTYILDSHFWKLYTEWRHLFPLWFQDRVVI